MDQRSVQTTETHQDTISAITALARILARQAARELADAELVDPVSPLKKDEGVENDQP